MYCEFTITPQENFCARNGANTSHAQTCNNLYDQFVFIATRKNGSHRQAQHPTLYDGKRFMTKQWTAADIPSQVGRRVLITGANSGIGYMAALKLARKGATLLLACRDEGRGKAAIARLLE